MSWLKLILKILRQAGIRVSVTPIWGTRGPAVALILEGVSWEQIRAQMQPEPEPERVIGDTR